MRLQYRYVERWIKTGQMAMGDNGAADYRMCKQTGMPLFAQDNFMPY
jgi:hypothetical protein